MSLTSSSEFSTSELSEIVEDDDSVVVTPICPVCHKNYNEKVEPMSLQPCGHGICIKCLAQLKVHAGREIPKCPICRDPIQGESINWDLREITTNIPPNTNGYWEKSILELACISGRRIKISGDMHQYAKAICIRLAFDSIFVHMKDNMKALNSEEKSAVFSMKNALVRAARRTDDDMETLCKWISIFAFPEFLESYYVKFFMQWYENKSFLDDIGGAWLMDVITHPV